VAAKKTGKKPAPPTRKKKRATPRRSNAAGRGNARARKAPVTKKARAALQAAFLAAVSETGNITAAAKVAGVARASHYSWLESDDGDYVERFKAAFDEAGDRLETEARRRAMEGVEEPTGWYKGVPGGYVQRYSDRLLEFLLRAAKPEKYRERYEFDHKGTAKTPSVVEVVVRQIEAGVVESE
jgi:hypothetical protein